MKSDVYYYLLDYGFDNDEIDKIEDVSDDIFFTNLLEVRKNIKFLEEKGLDVNEVIDAINYNPYLLTEKNNRLEAFDDIFYNTLLFNTDELKKLIIDNPDIYTASPIELKKIIKYMNDNGMSYKDIKNVFIKTPKVVSYDYDEYPELVKDKEV